MKLVFATNNPHKIKEIQQAIPAYIQLVSLKEAGINTDIPENQPTIEGNASEKAWYVHTRIRENCFADDTGLEIEALDSRPGVKSARYAGPECDPDKNIDKVLQELDGKDDRRACFRTIISLIIDGKEHQFEGRVDGNILRSGKGGDGFGYDPIFQPEGYDQTFAEMPLSVKNEVSHRGKAVQKVIKFLKLLESGS